MLTASSPKKQSLTISGYQLPGLFYEANDASSLSPGQNLCWKMFPIFGVNYHYLICSWLEWCLSLVSHQVPFANAPRSCYDSALHHRVLSRSSLSPHHVPPSRRTTEGTSTKPCTEQPSSTSTKPYTWKHHSMSSSFFNLHNYPN